MRTEPARWRLLVDPALSGARNMARDVAMLEAVASGEAPPTFRFYGWDPPCLTLGRHQGLEGANIDFCCAEGIDVVRRPTGGRALLHHLELTYAVVAPLGVPPLPQPLQDAYRAICGALVNACRELGVAAELTGGEVNLQLPGPRSNVPCFEAPAGGEVVVGGGKLIGSAMRAQEGFILQHGAILLAWDGRLQAGALGLSDDKTLRPQITTFAEQLGRAVDRHEVESAIVEAFTSGFGLEFVPGEMTELELGREAELVETFAHVG
jgi:lipoate-protein ligase A